MTTENSEQRPIIGLALSGGGARGFAHVGVLKALEELGIVPDIISGVSAGAVVSVMYASGLSPEKILELFDGKKFSDLAEISVPKDGFFKLDKFKRFLRKGLPVKTFEELKIPTCVCATDMENSRSVIFKEGQIAERVTASCCIPIIFKPIKIDGVNYVDGGVLRNLPAWAIRKKCDILIGVNVSPLVNRSYKSSIIEIAHRSYELMAKNNAIADMKLCDVLIQTKSIANESVFKIKSMYGIADKGYKDALAALKDNTIIKNIIQQQQL